VLPGLQNPIDATEEKSVKPHKQLESDIIVSSKRPKQPITMQSMEFSIVLNPIAICFINLG
jgi:hypothetical protein